MGRAVRPAGRIAGLADHARPDIGIGADQEVRGDVLKHDPSRGVEPAANVDAGRSAPRRLKGFGQSQYQPHRAAGPQRQKRHQRLVLGPALAAERAARIGRDDPHPRIGQPRTEATTRCST